MGWRGNQRRESHTRGLTVIFGSVAGLMALLDSVLVRGKVAMREEPWIAHEEPDRPFDVWMWLDDCEVCREALKREADEHPRLVFCLKTGMDRIWVTAEALHETCSQREEIESLCYVEGDWVREVCVVDGSLPPSVSWRSLILTREVRGEVPGRSG